MVQYPSYSEIGWSAPEEVEYQFKTLKSQFDDQGREKRRRKWLYPKRKITLQYNNISHDDARTLWQFYIDRQGSYDSFTFYLKDVDNYTKEYVCTGDNETYTYSLPSKEASNYTFYNNDDELLEVTDYTFYSSLGPSGGVDGSDSVTFVSAPNDDERVTYSFHGILRVNVRFKEDNLSFQTFYRRLTTTGIELQGLLIDDV